MVATPDPSEQPSSPALSTSARPTSLDHGSTMEITSALPDSHLNEAQPPDSPVTPERENESGGSTEGAPAMSMSSPVQFIGINYFPPSPVDVQTTSSQPRAAHHATPWESGAASPLSEDYVVVGLPTFPPKPCVFSLPVSLFCSLAPAPTLPYLIHIPFTVLFCSAQLTLSSAAPGEQGVAAYRFHRTVLYHRDAIRYTIHHLWDGLGYITRER